MTKPFSDVFTSSGKKSRHIVKNLGDTNDILERPRAKIFDKPKTEKDW